MKMQIAANRAGSSVRSILGKGGMKAVRSIPALLMFLVAFSTLSVNRADGTECTGDNSVTHTNAQCLSFSHNASSVPGEYSDWSASTSCADYGDVVARIVLPGQDPDTVYHTLNSDSSSASGTATVANTQPAGYCCKDRGDLCNRSDVVTSANCTTQFNASNAADSCTLVGDPTVNSDHTTCIFTATCGDTTYTDRSMLYTSMDDMEFCDGTFYNPRYYQVDDCD